MQRGAKATWAGDIKHGTGSVSSASGLFQEAPFDFGSRFERAEGTNPEELVAAAHASCFSMAFAKELGDIGARQIRIETEARVRLEHSGNAWTVTHSDLTTRGTAAEIGPGQFEDAARRAKENCPISRLLKAEIDLHVEFMEEEDRSFLESLSC
jgi:lipoyl-dependent peroxiredoxin